MAGRQQPIQSYYPSARIRLGIRFEDYGEDDTPETPEKPPQVRRGKKDEGPKLEVVERDGRLLLIAQGDDPNAVGSPQEQRRSEDGRTQWIDGIIPIRASHSRNGVRTADTLVFDLEFADMPIHPMTIRGCAVQYLLGTATEEDFQRGIYGEMKTTAGPHGSGTSLNVVPDKYTDINGRERTNLRFEGWVDRWVAGWDEGAGPVITAECTDNTRLLIDQEHPTKLALSIDVPLHRAVAGYLSNFPQFRGLGVIHLPSTEEPPVLKEVLNKKAYPPGVGPTATKSADGKLSVWDYLTDVTRSVGYNIRFEGTTIILQKPRALYNRRFPARADDPFQGRIVPGIGAVPHRLMIYGQNILSMTWERVYNSAQNLKNVEVRCYHSASRKTLIARYPQVNERTKKLSTGDAADQPFLVIPLVGIQNEAVLRSIAQQVYEEIGRNELQVTVMTKNLGSFGGGNLDPDLLDAIPGDAIDVVVQRNRFNEDDHNTVNTIQGELERRPAEFLRQLGFPAEFADQYAKAVSHMGVQNTFHIKEIHVDWDKEGEGVQIDFDAVNYIEVRGDAQLPEGEETPAPDGGEQEPAPVIVEDEVTIGSPKGAVFLGDV